VPEAAAAALALAIVVVWGALSGRLERTDLTAPIVFVTAGVALDLTGILDLGDLTDLAGPIRLLAELTLVMVLFSDASRVRLTELRADTGLYVRLLLVGLPLAVLFGVGLAAVLLPGSPDIWLLILVGAALAPTDAALGVPVIANRAVPSRIRRALNVESGLNDGIATPVVLAAIAGVAMAEQLTRASSAGGILLSLGLGLLSGLVVGAGGGWLVRTARGRGWVDESFGGPTVLALALLAFVAAVAVDGNGFVAAFVGGLAFRNACGQRTEREVSYVEQSGGALSLVVWLLFGAVVVPIVVDRLDWRTALYAVLSLTAVRMVAVVVAMVGSGFRPATVAFVGWFGPRGLASVIFALIAVEELGSVVDQAVAFIGLTVLLSVLAHGVSAHPLAVRYGAAVSPTHPAESAWRPDLPVRRTWAGRQPDHDGGSAGPGSGSSP
jgi:NhaP-type Na+/H+ or K+/H+ antiporter